LNQKNSRTKSNDKKSKIDDLLRKSKEDELGLFLIHCKGIDNNIY
jgi:hypothetical protein